MRTNFKLFRQDVEEALKPLEEKYGIKARVAAISFNDLGFKANLECDYVGEQADQSRERHFRQVAELMGINPNYYGVVVQEKSGKRYKIVDINANAPKNCLVIEEVGTKKSYRAPKAWADKHIES